MNPYRAAPRRHLSSSPFKVPDPEPPAERFAVDDLVTHDKYGLGPVTGVDDVPTSPRRDRRPSGAR